MQHNQQINEDLNQIDNLQLHNISSDDQIEMNSQQIYQNPHYQNYKKKEFYPKTEQGKKIIEILKKYNIEEDLLSQFLIQMLNFKQRPTEIALCNKVFQVNQKIFQCHDCRKHKNACLCQQCFKESDHKGHQFYFALSSSQNFGMCDCGNQQVWEKSGFCKNHSGKTQYINIPENQQRQFIQIWTDIFGIYFNLVTSKEKIQFEKGLKLKQSINQILKKLNFGSMYYQQLTAQLINSLDPIDTNEKTIFQSLLSTHAHIFEQEDMDLIIILYFNQQYTKRMAKSFIKCHNQHPNLVSKNNIQDFFYQLLNKVEFFEQLAKQDIIFESQKLNYLHVHNISKLMSFQQCPPIEIIKCMIRKQFIKKHLKEFPKINFNKKNYIIPNMIKTLIKNNLKEEVVKIVKQLMSVDQFYSSKYFFMAISYLKFQFQKTIEKKINYQNLFEEMEVPKQELKQYLFQQYSYNIRKNIKQGIFKQFAFILKILNEFDWIDEYFTLFMKLIKFQHQKLQNKDKILLVVSNSLFIQSMLKTIACFQLLQLQAYDFYQIKNQQIFQRIKQYLKLNLSISPKDISQNKFQRIVNEIGAQFKNQLAPFIRQNIKYNQKKLTYNYIGEIPDVNPYKGSQIDSFGQKYSCLNKEQTQILSKIFNDKSVDQIINQIFESIKLGEQYTAYFQKYLPGLFKSLTKLYSFLGQKVPKIKDFLSKIKSFEINIFELIKNKRVQEELQKILQIKKIEIQNNPQTKQKDFKQKAAEMKKKKFEELRKKQQKVQSIQNNCEQFQKLKEVVQQQICLLCHQKSQNQNSLVSFVNINKTNALSWSFDSKIDQYDLRRCQHKIHENCFTKYFGNRQNFQCLLCKEVFNGIIPCQFQKQLKIKNSIWMTRIQTFLACNQYKDNISVFQVFVRNLIYSKALKIFIQTDEKHLKQRKKTEIILEKLIKIIYHQADRKEKNKYLQIINNLLNQVQKEYQLSQKACLSKKIRVFFIRMLAYWLDQKQHVKNLTRQLQILTQLMKIIDKKYIQRLMQGIPQIIQSDQNFIKIFQQIGYYYEQKEFNNNNQIINNCIQLHQFPDKIEDYLKKFDQKCQKCKQDYQNAWICLICKKRGCQLCQKSRNHLSQIHNGNCIILKSYDAKWALYYHNAKIIEESLYKNDYNEPWNRKTSTKQNNNLNKDLLNNIFNSFIINQIPQIIDRKKLVDLLNKKFEEDW